MKQVRECFTKNYCNFRGRASRKEYWLFYLVTNIWILCLALGFGALPILALRFLSEKNSTVFLAIFIVFIGLVSIIPHLAVTVRRLHDTNRSGWFQLVAFVPIVGPICLFVILCLKGNKGVNSYGDDPLRDIA